MNLFDDVAVFSKIGESMHFKTASRTDLITLCKKLIDEEAKETSEALKLYFESGSLEHLAEAVDGAVDTIYVCAFFLNQMGLNAEAHWNLVQSANMAKFQDGIAIKNEYGKIQKPAGWKPPDHLPLLIEWNSKMRGESYRGGLIRHDPIDEDSRN